LLLKGIIHLYNIVSHIIGCSTDSNKDKYLNSHDLQELFIYDFQEAKTTKIIAKENYTTINIYQPNSTGDLIVHFGIDRNKDGRFDMVNEPMIFYKVMLEDMTLKEFVSKEQIIKIQNLLDGK